MQWRDDANLTPVIQDDALLFGFEDEEDFEEGADALAMGGESKAPTVRVNPTQVRVNPTQVCVNPTQVCVNPTQVCVSPTQVCVNATQVIAEDLPAAIVEAQAARLDELQAGSSQSSGGACKTCGEADKLKVAVQELGEADKLKVAVQELLQEQMTQVRHTPPQSTVRSERKLDHCLTLSHPIHSIFGLLGSWFGSEVALHWLFPYPILPTHTPKTQNTPPLHPAVTCRVPPTGRTP
jgi:hypothetical protein